MAKNYYIILGLKMDATQNEIKSAYRRLAKELHPDRYMKGCEPFKEIQEAYSTLSDPVRRREYDSTIRDVRRKRPVEDIIQPYAQGKPAYAEPLLSEEQDANLADVFLTLSFRTFTPSFDEIFDRLWSNYSSLERPKEEMRKNLTAEITLTPDQASRGGHARIFIPAESMCPSCHGSGGVGFYECWRCAGEGAIRGEFPIMASYPSGVRDNHTVLIPLDRFGIRNLYLTVCFRITRGTGL